MNVGYSLLVLLLIPVQMAMLPTTVGVLHHANVVSTTNTNEFITNYNVAMP